MSTKRTHILKQTCTGKLQVRLSMRDLLVDTRHERAKNQYLHSSANHFSYTLQAQIETENSN